MIFRRTNTFKRQYKKLSKKLQQTFDDRFLLWLEEPTNSKLMAHPLKGEFKGYWSINITGDLRALYYFQGEEIVVFAFAPVLQFFPKGTKSPKIFLSFTPGLP